ncbi:hypothetical protein DR950_33675 [Kitasatospora xanthocidica]|uniref:Uncharacterized protein n=1 Tax=Kitasatospora xanthocidica TaxID=83382 RepID=A0A373A1K8_9ACTN|nr:hypothetical protein [Kitasatospora xanthocidica]RGD62036.1 hypothetical protein DR950_33675 [Kitasatospora xanthocidica]
MRGLPAEALLRRDEAEVGADRWGLTQELLAQVVELLSVLAAEHRLRRPVELPRPAHLSTGRARGRDGKGMARAVAVLRRSGKAAGRG